jgi:hypothetical protein
MIKVKLSPVGGYVMGDGECPFDPDDFMHMFMNRIIEAQRAGLQVSPIPEDDVNLMLAEQKVKARQLFEEGVVRLYEEGTAPQILLGEDAI